MKEFGLDLPEYPWDRLLPYRQKAQQHPDGLIDLSIGTPVDPTPAFIQEALAAAADAHSYPTTQGSLSLRQAIVGWFERRRGVPGLSPEQVLPTVGSKEMVAWLPFFLGLGPGDVVVRPRIAYPTYDIGARLAGAEVIAADSLQELEGQDRQRVKLVWVNSPSNPTGIVRDKTYLRQLVEDARQLGAVLASDECYAELGWDQWDVQAGGQPVPSLLDPQVSGGSSEQLFALYSLSKQSNLAGYRAAFMAGDERLLPRILNARKHAGMIVPGPVQAAMELAVGDDEHVSTQKSLYRRRRQRLLAALQAAGFVVEGSQAGLYLWTRGQEDTWASLDRFARLGILVGPGVFYGREGAGYLRLALTGSDEHIEAAARRLLSS